MADRYPALISKGPHTGWNVVFPDLPGCDTAGLSIDEVLVSAEETLALHVHSLFVEGKPVPEPGDIEGILAEAKGEAFVLVPLVPLKGATKRINVSLDEHLLAEIDASAARIGTDRSKWLAAAARDRLAESGDPAAKPHHGVPLFAIDRETGQMRPTGVTVSSDLAGGRP
jgi:predicted RNase H-like HicB family nuclease